MVIRKKKEVAKGIYGEKPPALQQSKSSDIC
jgi:hypothetical protein